MTAPASRPRPARRALDELSLPVDASALDAVLASSPDWLAEDRRAAFEAWSTLPGESNLLYTPYIDIQEDDTNMSHEATVGKVSAEQVFYLMSRGLTENEATNLIVQGFLEVFTKELPMEYAIEFNRLVKLEMEGSLG